MAHGPSSLKATARVKELDSTSLQAVGSGRRLVFLLSARLLGRLGLLVLYSSPISVGEAVGVCRHILKQALSIHTGWVPFSKHFPADQVTLVLIK